MEEKKSFLNLKVDRKSPNKNIVPITTTIGEDGKLSIGGCSLEELVNDILDAGEVRKGDLVQLQELKDKNKESFL